MNITVESIIALVTDPRAIRESNDSKVYTYTSEATMLTRRFSNSNKWMKQSRIRIFGLGGLTLGRS